MMHIATMIKRYKQSLRTIINQLKLHPLNNSTTATESNVEKVSEKVVGIQNVIKEKCDIILKQFNESTVSQKHDALQLQPMHPIPKQIKAWWQWYQYLTGLSEVEAAKRNVISVQDKLFTCQQNRRNLMHQVNTINNQLKNVYGELIQTRRDDPKYVHLTITENNILQEHNKINGQLNLLEREEKDYFTLLTNAIAEYHDTQTLNTQKYKYISILASAIFAIVSLIASMIYNNKRIVDIRNIIAASQKSNESMFIEEIHDVKNIINTNFSSLAKIMMSEPNQYLKDIEKWQQHQNKQQDEFTVLPEIPYMKIGGIILTLYFLSAIFSR